MKRVCLVLILSVMTLQESASKSTFRAPINNLAGNQWPWAWGVSTQQNYYDNHYGPIANSQVNRGRYDPSLVVTNSHRYLDADSEIIISDKDLADQRKTIRDLEKSLELTNSEIMTLNTVLADQIKKTGDLEKDLADQTKKTGDLEKDLADQTIKTGDLEKDLADQTKKTGDLEKSLELTNREVITLNKEVEAREAENDKIKTEVNSIDGRLNKTEKKKAVCGYTDGRNYTSGSATLSFDQVYDEVDVSSGEGTLEKNGFFQAGVAGIYFITLETSVSLNDGESLVGHLELSSGNYASNHEEYFIRSTSAGGFIRDQASASRYVSMLAGETLHISLVPGGLSNGSEVGVFYTTMCVSLYSASG